MEQETFTLINQARTCAGTSVSDWPPHVVQRWKIDKYFKFIVINIIMKKRTLEQSTYIMKEQIGDEHMSLHDLKQRIQIGDDCSAQKML